MEDRGFYVVYQYMSCGAHYDYPNKHKVDASSFNHFIAKP